MSPDGTRSGSHRIRACLACAVALALYAAVTPPGVLAGGPQRLQWAACGDGFECATATVPLDYGRPRSGTQDLAVTRRPATQPADRLGSLFVSFGGALGASAQTLRGGAIAGFASLNDRYDIVAFDARGTSGADAIDCKSGSPEEHGPWAQPFPRPRTVNPDPLVAGYRSYIDRCVASNPRLLPYVSTADAARDMNRIRRALGDQQVNYFGYSYGTLLGATFETLFPRRVGRFVLDGAADATWLTDPIRSTRETMNGFEVALDRFLQACAANQTACGGFGATEPDAAFDGLVARLNAAPIATGGGDPRTVDGDDVLSATGFALYDKHAWPVLGDALARAAAGDGGPMRTLTDLSYFRRPDGSYDPFLDRTFAITSLERRFPSDRDLYLRAGAEAYERFDHFWASAYSGLAQAMWPVRANGVFRGPFRAPSSGPTTLVVGTTHDPTTPYAGAQRLTRQLGNARLLTMRGDGHTAYGANSPCINMAVDAYLERGAVPAAGTVCEQQVPFERPPR